MTQRLIPNGDQAFSDKAYALAQALAREPDRFGVTSDEAAEMLAAAERFKKANAKNRTAARSTMTTLEKDEARAECERIYRRCVARIRLNENIDSATLCAAGLSRPNPRRQARTVPQEPPRLRFVRALHEGSATPVHELDFRALDGSSAKPAGAARLELFVDLIGVDEPIPSRPGANWAGRPWYLRSYSRSPIRLVPPIPRVPMRVVYWGRWADATGNVGPFSATTVGWIEGGVHQGLPGAPARYMDRARQVPIVEAERISAPDTREPRLLMAVLEAQYDSLAPTSLPDAAPALPEPKNEPRQLTGPSEAADENRDAA